MNNPAGLKACLRTRANSHCTDDRVKALHGLKRHYLLSLERTKQYRMGVIHPKESEGHRIAVWITSQTMSVKDAHSIFYISYRSRTDKDRCDPLSALFGFRFEMV
jgi:hypothetical protein